MKRVLTFSYLSILLVAISLLGCQKSEPTPAPNSGATISAAVNATSSAQAAFSATLDAAVKATQAAQPTLASASAANKTATPKPGATATPSVSYVTMTEEELAALIDQAVKEAVAATTTATTTTTTTTSDSSLTTAEVQALTAAATTAQTEINQALALAQAYYDLYAEIAPQTLAALQAIEQDLNSMASSMSSMATSLSQISTTMAQGQAAAQSAITQLQSTATKASTAAASAQTKEKTWTQTVQNDVTKRGNDALAVKPNSVPTDLKGTVGSVNTYVDSVRTALTDSKITQKELQGISQAGANATAGLAKFGGGDAQGLSSSINGITKQIARGEAPKARTSFSSLEQSARSFASLPSAPSGPGGPPQPQITPRR